MKQPVARNLIIVSLVLSSLSFLISLCALYLANWKYIELRFASTPIVPSDDNQMDPLIRGEIERYIETLYRRGQIHSFGLSSHCIVGTKCGENLLPSFTDSDYSICHSIKHHQQCIFPHLSSPSEKCTCRQPSYISTIRVLLTISMLADGVFLLANILRLYRRRSSCFNDIQMRLTAIISALLSSIFLLTVIIQHNNNRLYEPLVYFETMREHYSHRQIYAFTQDLDLIIRQIVGSLNVDSGSSFIGVILTFIFMTVSFFTSSSVEIKLPTTFDDEEKKVEYDHTQTHPSSTLTDRFVPYEHIRFPRQTKV